MSNDLEKYWNRFYEQKKAPIRPEAQYLRFLNFVDLGSCQAALDIACGGGGLVKAMPKSLRRVGLDFSAEALDVARKIVPNAEFIHGSANDLPFPDNSFDTAFNIGALHNLDQPEKGLAEMARVVRPGGELCIVLPNSQSLAYPLVKARFPEKIAAGFQPLSYWLDLVQSNPSTKIKGIFRDPGPVMEANTSIIGKASQMVRSMLIATTNSLPLKYAYQFVFILEVRQPEG